MERIVVIGSPGAGKSTFAQALGTILAIKVFHLDRHFWQAGWKEYPRKTRLQIQEDLVRGEDRWIMEGTYLSSSDERLYAADTIIFLDMPRFLCLWRIIKRHITSGQYSRPDIPDGCTDKLGLLSILKVLVFPQKGRRLLLKKIKCIRTSEKSSPKQKTIHVLQSRRDIENFLQRLSGRQQVAGHLCALVANRQLKLMTFDTQAVPLSPY